MSSHHLDTSDLLSELIHLRKGRGITADKLYNSPNLLVVLGGKTQVYEALVARLTSAIQSLADQPGREALLAAYGLLPNLISAPTLAERRQLYGQQVNRKYDTLAAREDSAIAELVVRLLSANYANAPLPTAIKLPTPHGRTLMESLDMRTLIKDRRFIYHEQTRTVIALVDKAIGFQYDSNETTVVTPLKGCSVKSTPLANGHTKHLLLFTNPLKRGQSHTFSFREETKEPSPPADKTDWAGQSFESPTYRYSQTVTFEGQQPKAVWSYYNLSWIARPGLPAEQSQLQPDKHGVAKATFNDLHSGLFSGVAWEW